MTPAAQLVELLALARRTGATFPEAWPAAVARALAGAEADEQEEWLEALEGTRAAWAARGSVSRVRGPSERSMRSRSILSASRCPTARAGAAVARSRLSVTGGRSGARTAAGVRRSEGRRAVLERA